jgi:hypothetical protein
MIAPPPGVTSLRGRANAVVVLLIANVGWSLVSIGAVLGELDILERARDGRFVSQAEALASDDRVRTATTIALVLNVVTIVGWLVWQHRGQRNLSRLGVRQLRFTPAWAVGWWFVPIANLWKPFQSVRELWRASRAGVDDATGAGERTWPVIGWWWGVWLVSNITLRLSVSMDRQATLDDYIGSDNVDLVQEALSIVAAILAIAVVRSITRRQEAKIVAGPAVPPRPDMQKGWGP